MKNKLSENQLSINQLKLVNDLIDKVSNRQLSDFGRISSDIKSDGTLITACDKWSDELIVNSLEKITNKNEGILSEEGSQEVPNSSCFWVVDPLDGTTNFAAGIPYWAISIARFENGIPETAFLDIPALNKRIVAIRGKGVSLNNKKIEKKTLSLINNNCVSLCSRSIKILQLQPKKAFPGKIRLLGVSSLNMTSVALGQTIGAIEATPKIWDLAAAWLILTELGCCIEWLDCDPIEIKSGENLRTKSFPLLTSSSQETHNLLLPWAKILIENN
tara:strand:+ start:14864 stop:15685 length:822 start_codon:yes stop_codon:yes gene_type:complete